MIRWPIQLLFRLLALPFRLVFGVLKRLRMGRRPLVEVVIGGGKRPGLAERAEMLRVLELVRQDARVRVLCLDIQGVDMGLAAAKSLRDALLAIRASGTRVLARMDSADDRSMYLASAADEVWMPPGGELHLTGLAAPMMFYGEAIGRLGLSVEIEAAGVYKSFGEPYFRAYPSRANREATNGVLQGLHEHIQEVLAQSRGRTVEEIDLASRTGPFSADQAAEMGLVDKVGYPDEMADVIEEYLSGRPRRMDLDQYRRRRRMSDWLGRLGRSRQHVAVLYLQGAVVERAGRVGRAKRVIASDDVVPVLDALRDNAQIKGVVLVIDSPGGSALASDLIARSVERLRSEKPVVSVMDCVAASGGYYIAAPTNEIIANESTLTGSIGVIGGKVVFGGALGAMGIHVEKVGPGADAGMYGAHEGFTADQRRRFRASLKRVYGRFIAVVAAGRERSEEEILKVAEGRVWTGSQAVDNGLVDHIGGLPVALERLRELADLGDAKIGQIPFPFDPPRWSFLNMALGRAQVQKPTAAGLALDAVGPAALFLEQVMDSPLQAQAIEAVPWDEAAWETWRQSP